MSGIFFSDFLFISTHISLDLLYLGSAEAYIGWGGKLNSHLMASCVRNIRFKNYQNLIISFQVAVKKVRGVFLIHSVNRLIISWNWWYQTVDRKTCCRMCSVCSRQKQLEIRGVHVGDLRSSEMRKDEGKAKRHGKNQSEQFKTVSPTNRHRSMTQS